MIKTLEEIQNLSGGLLWTHITRAGLLYIPKNFGLRKLQVVEESPGNYFVRLLLIKNKRQLPPTTVKVKAKELRYLYFAEARLMFGHTDKNTLPLGFQRDGDDLVARVQIVE